jgi:hypothetical protein
MMMMMGNLENEGKRHFVSCRAREKHNFQDYLTVNQSVDTSPLFLSFFLSFLCPSHALAKEYFPFYCART